MVSLYQFLLFEDMLPYVLVRFLLDQEYFLCIFVGHIDNVDGICIQLVVQLGLVLLLEGIVDVGNDNPPFNQVRKNLEQMMNSAARRDSQIIIGTYFRLHPDGFRIAAGSLAQRQHDIGAVFA